MYKIAIAINHLSIICSGHFRNEKKDALFKEDKFIVKIHVSNTFNRNAVASDVFAVEIHRTETRGVILDARNSCRLADNVFFVISPWWRWWSDKLTTMIRQ